MNLKRGMGFMQGKIKLYGRAKEECINNGCKCVDCLLNHNNEKHCCWNCGTCSSENCGTIKYDHLKKECGSYIKRGKK